MQPKIWVFSFFLAVSLGISTSGTMAQDGQGLTEEELALLFAKQKTRGLVIIPLNQDQADGTGDTAVVPDPAYVPVEKSDQVNVLVSFDFDSAALRKDQTPKLATLCQVMQTVDVQLFQIVGHTDSSGSAEYNQNLSLLRAQEVKRYLVSDCGISEDRLVAIGAGESAPFDADDPAGDINRRVEFQALG
ncbi:MAG: OmpA family protein [Alphaproteobacteria bacterium]|nr:OmpA family protein [Alphaproteobacteria bacterium]